MKRYRIGYLFGLAFLLIAPIAIVLAQGKSDAPGKASAATKALAGNAQLRNELATETFKKLKEHSNKASIDGQTYYFVEGDLRLTEDELLFFARHLDAQHQKYKEVKAGISTPSPAGAPLMVHVVNGQIMRWEPGSTLRYCVLKKTFSQSEYDAVVKNITTATTNWENTCNINFEYVPQSDLDNPAATPPTGLTFTVRKVDDPNGPIASAFFPGDPTTDRHLLLFPDYFTTTFDKVGVLRHELGHVLGFRHEHIRSEAPPVCQGEPIFEAIPATDYDPQSVMHYFCGGSGSLALGITPVDREGARMIYGAPITAIAGQQRLAQPLDAAVAALKSRFNNVKP